MAWLWISSAFINVIMQELLVHGYIYQLLKTRYNLKLAVIITTAIFTFLHGGAFEAGSVAVINVITMYLFTTAIYETENTILAPIMAHTIWNIVGAIF
nr:CPBP family intramembrane glutamic endopeptidase [uncultured Mogibacterium sp.]